MFFSWFHLYGLLIGVGILLGLWVVERQTRWFDLPPEWLEQVLPWLLVGGIVGARLYHLATDWQLYQHASFWDLIAIWRGGVGFLGGLIGGFIGLSVWILASARMTKTKNLFVYLDLLSFGVPIAQAVGRIGNYVNGELYGLPTTLPWGIWVSGQRYQPLFLYELLLNVLLAIFLWTLARRHALVLGKGQYFALYLYGYATIRFWLEFLRVTTARWSGPLGIFSIAQWVCLIFMISATVLFWVRRHSPKKQWDWTLE